MTWGELCTTLCGKFAREQYQVHLRQFRTLKQMTTVHAYMLQFEEHMHQLLAHNPAFDHVFFTTQFLEGLKQEIRVGVLLHQPKDLDSAFSLASLQEELVEALPHREVRRQEVQQPRPVRPLLALGAPLVRPPLPGPPAAAEDRRGIDAAHAQEHGVHGDDRVAALRNYRRARGLCFKCGERWGQGHQCAPTVQLHIVEELLDLLQADYPDPADPEAVEEEEVLMSISKVATMGQTTPHTVRLLGRIAGKEILILVDSGNSHSFISEEVASRLSDKVQPMTQISVKIANGGLLSCSAMIPACTWQTQGFEFKTDMRVLQLGCYDMVVGMDWLQQCGPMWVDWKQKILQFWHNNELIELRGVVPTTTKVAQVSAEQLSAMEEGEEIAHIILLRTVEQATTGDSQEQAPAPIMELIEEFSQVFAEPTGLPQHKPWDHGIPLIPGAKPVNIRAYRYTPEQKTEIEAQVQEMLKAGLIVPSVSPFSSPVLLVKKKDQTWRFCVDFRHLNAITLKRAYPLPIIEELLDELAGSAWFSKLDLRAGYHQIGLLEEDEMKTAFTTHQGHFQFRVLPYGVAGGPPTFQGAMNILMHPLLRHGVLVFMDDILVHTKTMSEHLVLLRQVLQRLQEHDLRVKLSKCAFAQQEISYLGHKISKDGVATLDEHIKAVQTWEQPTTVKQLRGFLGLAGYYRKFVRNFGILARPLNDLLRKNTLFVWTPTTEAAFQALKHALIEAPVLALPDFSKQFVIETDANAKGIGAVLMQNSHPVAYLSRALAPRNLGLSAYEKECLALLMAVDHWRPYLQHSEFLIKTDQRSLLNLTDQRLNTPIQQRAFTKLVGLQFRIQYKAGTSNRAADALSRRVADPQAELAAISVCRPVWLDTIL